MKIAVITTKFLEEYVRYVLQKLRPRYDWEIFIYRDFQQVGELYLELEERFQGFLVSGPVPKAAILKHVSQANKPIVSFGTDAQCYYEVFFRVLYEQQDTYFRRGSFDLLDWIHAPQPMDSYLAAGTFGRLLEQVHESTVLRTLTEIAAMEKKVLQKHLTLWREGKIDYVVTRLSSIMPQLEEAGAKVYFVYPHTELIHSALDTLIKDIELHTMHMNQPAVICVTPVDRENAPVNQLPLFAAAEKALEDYMREYHATFVIQSGGNHLYVFTSRKEVFRLTEQFEHCSLKSYLEQKCGCQICLGYGLGRDLSTAMENALTANIASQADAEKRSCFCGESGDSSRTLHTKSCLAAIHTAASDGMPPLSNLAAPSSTRRIAVALQTLGTHEVTAQSLAGAMGITTRSANRILNGLLGSGQAQILYSVNNGEKGRPEKMYRILLAPTT